MIEAVLEKATRSKQRVLLGFDFAYVYPVDFGPALQTATGSSDRDLPWTSVWQYLSEHLKDDEGTRPGAKPSNRSNRFEVADRINALLSPDVEKTGPFWCVSEGASCQYIPQKRPPEPFQTAQGYLVRGLRLTDKRAGSGSPFRLFGTASVGSQSLTGIARLQGYEIIRGSQASPPFGHSRLAGPQEPNGFRRIPQFCTRRFTPALESRYAMTLRTEGRCVQCGSGPVTSIATICWGANFVARLKSRLGRRRIWQSSSLRAGFSDAHRQ